MPTTNKNLKSSNKTNESKKVLSFDEITSEVNKKKLELFEAKKSHLSGELVNPHAITKTRKQIARLLTQATKLSKERNNK